MTTKVLPFTESTLVTFKNKLHHLKESFRSISHQSCVTGTLLLRKKIYPRKYSLNLRQLIIFMFLHGWFFISYQTQIFACDPSRINWTATGAFPGGFADDDDDYSAEGLTGRVARSSAVTPRKQEATGVFPGGFADDDDEYPEEGLTGRVARSSAVTPRKQDGDGSVSGRFRRR